MREREVYFAQVRLVNQLAAHAPGQAVFINVNVGAVGHGEFHRQRLAFDADLTRTASIIGDQRQVAIGSEQWWLKGAVGTRFGLHWNSITAGQKTVAGGITVKLPRSLFAEGHVTKSQVDEDSDWGAGLRVTF